MRQSACDMNCGEGRDPAHVSVSALHYMRCAGCLTSYNNTSQVKEFLFVLCFWALVFCSVKTSSHAFLQGCSWDCTVNPRKELTAPLLPLLFWRFSRYQADAVKASLCRRPAERWAFPRENNIFCSPRVPLECCVHRNADCFARAVAFDQRCVTQWQKQIFFRATAEYFLSCVMQNHAECWCICQVQFGWILAEAVWSVFCITDSGL